VARVWRFLLDQNFPSPVLDVHAVDRTVEYESLTKFDASLTKGETPDWVIHLSAAYSARFDGVVTRDKRQLDQAEELVALTDTRISVVTWQQPVEDPIQEWGQLLAYMPLVTRRMQRIEKASGGNKVAHVFFLPRPRLGADNVHAARHLLGQLAAEQKRSFQEVRDDARREMRAELLARGLKHLDGVLGP
jgi:hypothetical protein